jgi:hypothetical protein
VARRRGGPVLVEIRIGDGARGEVSFSGTIDVPSGVLTVGDAELVRVWLQRE